MFFNSCSGKSVLAEIIRSGMTAVETVRVFQKKKQEPSDVFQTALEHKERSKSTINVKLRSKFDRHTAFIIEMTVGIEVLLC